MMVLLGEQVQALLIARDNSNRGPQGTIPAGLHLWW
jgi:hypothetical protein